MPAHGEHCVFPCQRWLAKNEDDGKIERDLLPGRCVDKLCMTHLPFFEFMTFFMEGGGEDISFIGDNVSLSPNVMGHRPVLPLSRIGN